VMDRCPHWPEKAACGEERSSLLAGAAAASLVILS